MARGRKKLSLDERIQDVEQKIADTRARLNDLLGEKEELERKAEEERVAEMMEAMERSGKSLDEIYAFLNGTD